MARQRAARTPPQPPSSTARNVALTIGAAVPPATSAAAGGLGIAAGVMAARDLIAGAVKAITSVHIRIGNLRISRIRERLTAAGLPGPDVEAALKREARLERVYQRRAAERVRKGMALALKAPDASARAAAIESVIRREQQFARQRAQASAERVYAAADHEQLQALSPLGAFWKLGHASEHTPDCLAMAGRFWPWSVLRLIAPPTHIGCQCELHSLGDAIANAWMGAGDIPSAAAAMKAARPVIEFVKREHGLEEAAEAELDVRSALALREGADLDALAAAPLAVDFALREAEASTGAMVALYPDPETAAALAVRDGEDPGELHMTLAFLGEAGSPAKQAATIAAVTKWAESCPPLEGSISGVGYFVGGPKPVTYLSVDLPQLPGHREELVRALDGAKVPPSRDHGFTPHVTLDYATRRPEVSKPIPIKFERVTVAWGGVRTSIPLAGKLSEVRDGDGDGFIFDGTPQQRPAVEGLKWAGKLAPAELTGPAASAHLRERTAVSEENHPGIAAYLGNGYGAINDVADGSREPTPEVVAWIAQLDSAITEAQPSAKSVEVFRATPRRLESYPGGQSAEVGKVIDLGRYMSTTTNEVTAHGYTRIHEGGTAGGRGGPESYAQGGDIWRIRVPAGERALFMRASAPGAAAKDEDEALYMRGSSLLVVSVQPEGASLFGRPARMIEAELIP